MSDNTFDSYMNRAYGSVKNTFDEYVGETENTFDSFMSQGPKKPGVLDSLASSGKMAWNSFVGGVGAGERNVGSVMSGIPGLSGIGDALVARGSELMKPVPGEEPAPQFTDVWANPTPKAALDFITTSVTGTLPQMAAVAVGGLAGAAGGPLGALSGAFAVGWVLEAGNDYQDLIEQGVSHEEAAKIAGFTGAAKGILEAAPIVGRVGRRLIFGKTAQEAATSGIRGTIKEVGKDALAEGTTEGAQELVGIGGESYAGIRHNFQESVARVLNAAAAGAVAGPVFSAGIQAIDKAIGDTKAESISRAVGDPVNPALPDIVDPPKDPQIEEKPKQVDVPEPEISDRPSRNFGLELQSRAKDLYGEDSYRTKMLEVFSAEEMAKFLNTDPSKVDQELAALEDAITAKLIKRVDGGYKFTELATRDYDWFADVLVDPVEDPRNPQEDRILTEQDITIQYKPQHFENWVIEVENGPRLAHTNLPIRFDDAEAKLLPPSTKEKLRQSPFINAFTAVHDKYVKKATEILSQDPDLANLATIFNLPYYLKGAVAQIVTPNPSITKMGKFLGASDRGYIEFNPLGEFMISFNSPKSAAHGNFVTLVHELTHSLVLNHEENFHRTEAILMRALKGLETDFRREMEDIYDPGRTGKFSKDLLSDYLELTSPGTSVQTGTSSEQKGTGLPPIPGNQGRGNLSGLPGNQPSAGSERAGSSGIGRADGYELRGDFPSAAPDYLEGLNQIRAIEELRRTQQGVTNDFGEDTELNPALEEMVSFLKIPGINPQAKKQIFTDTVKYGKFSRHCLFLHQVWDRNKNLVPMQQYMQAARRFWQSKTEITLRFDTILRNTWPAWNKPARKLNKLIEAVTLESLDKKRRLSILEVNAIATKLDAQSLVPKWKKIDESLLKTLDDLENAIVANVQNLYGSVISPVVIKKIRRDFKHMKNRNYFPFTRFGRYGVIVKAKNNTTYNGKHYAAGRVVYFAGHQNKSEMEEDFHNQVAANKSPDLEVRHVLISDAVQEFIGFPPALLDIMASKLKLTPQQVIDAKDLVLAMSPGRSFMKHMRKKRGIAGYSEDFQRAYAGYGQSASNHIARIRHEQEFDAALDGLRILGRNDPYGNTSYMEMYEGLAKHRDDLYNPGDSFGAARGFLTLYYFAFHVAQAMTNSMQTIMQTFPYLAKRHPRGLGVADMQVAKLLFKASWDSMLYWKNPAKNPMEPYVMRALARATQEGLIDQGFATEIAAVHSKGTLNRGLVPNPVSRAWRLAMDHSMIFMSVPEKNNRRVALVSAMRMAMQELGMNESQAYDFAAETINNTQGVYERWARPEIMRGRKSLLFLFKAFAQQQAYFGFTNKGGWRFWAIALAMVGFQGLPGVEDIMMFLSMFGTSIKTLFGMEDPKLDVKAELRNMVDWVGLNPDTFMHGASRHFFGLSALGQLAGLPIPNLDFSGMMSSGEFIGEDVVRLVAGGTAALATKAMGRPDANPLMGQNPTELFLRAATRIAGPAGGLGANMVKAAADNSPDRWHWLQYVMPRQVKNVMKAAEMATYEATLDSQGKPLVTFDPNNPTQFMEIVGQFLGVPPTVVGQRVEEYMAYQDHVQYYNARRQYLLSALNHAIRNGETETIADVREAIREANKTFPKEFRITGMQMARSVQNARRNAALQEAGVPPQRKYRDIKEDFERLYPTLTER